METCGACRQQFPTLAEVFSHPCPAIQAQPAYGKVLEQREGHDIVANGFGGTTARTRMSEPGATDRQLGFIRRLRLERGLDPDAPIPGGSTKANASRLIDTLMNERPSGTPAAGPVQTPEAVTDESFRALVLEKFVDAKLEVADVTQPLRVYAHNWVRAWRPTGATTFQFLEEMQDAALRGMLSPGQAKGVLNCIRADVLRNRPLDPGQPGLDLSVLPKSGHGVLRVAIEDHAEGQLVFMQICQNRASGIVVLQEVGGNEPLYLGTQRPGHPYKGKRTVELEAVLADPEAAVRRYGRELSHCGHCGAQLTDETSRAFGMGPKCRTKWGV